MYTDEVMAVFTAFEECGSMKELRRQLDAGLISQLDFSKATLENWGYFKRMPQYSHLSIKD